MVLESAGASLESREGLAFLSNPRSLCREKRAHGFPPWYPQRGFCRQRSPALRHLDSHRRRSKSFRSRKFCPRVAEAPGLLEGRPRGQKPRGVVLRATARLSSIFSQDAWSRSSPDFQEQDQYFHILGRPSARGRPDVLMWRLYVACVVRNEIGISGAARGRQQEETQRNGNSLRIAANPPAPQRFETVA